MDVATSQLITAMNKHYHSLYPNCKANNITALKHSSAIFEHWHFFSCFLTFCLSLLFLFPWDKSVCWPGFIWSQNSTWTHTKTNHTQTLFMSGEVSDFSKRESAILEDGQQMAPRISKNDIAFCTLIKELRLVIKHKWCIWTHNKALWIPKHLQHTNPFSLDDWLVK